MLHILKWDWVELLSLSHPPHSRCRRSVPTVDAKVQN
jgi:hypothetical protein